MFIKRQKYKRLYKINKASNKLKILIESKDYNYGFNRLKLETKVIKIQTQYRRYLARKEL